MLDTVQAGYGRLQQPDSIRGNHFGKRHLDTAIDPLADCLGQLGFQLVRIAAIHQNHLVLRSSAESFAKCSSDGQARIACALAK